MPVITINKQGHKETIEVSKGTILLHALRENNIDIVAPCGGNGTCGKCRVMVKGDGLVTSCIYEVNKSIEIVLPDVRESRILERQHEFSRVMELSPGKEAELVSFPHGIAVDVGTTTIVCYMVNLISGTVIETRSGINPQNKYGADVITRIQYAGKGRKQLKQLQRELIRFINDQVSAFSEITDIDKALFVKIVIAANNTMLHLIMGEDPSSLALVPFTPVFTTRQKVKARELGIMVNKEAVLTLLPSVSAYVGSDIVAGIASIDPKKGIKNFLFLDIGTNGELALVTPEKIYCCATAAGPAFEGANISCGMGAVSGAIKSFTDRDYEVVGNEKPTGICGSGLIDIVAWLLDQGLIEKDGLLPDDFVVVPAEQTPHGMEIKLTQQDIREIQLAKSAILSGIKILMNVAGMDWDQTDALILAGGFGNYINIHNAIRLGILPSEMKKKIIPLGNTSGTGAIIALKSTGFEQIMEKTIQQSVVIELSTNDNFQMEFAMNMYF